jgi:hypothetical protein
MSTSFRKAQLLVIGLMVVTALSACATATTPAPASAPPSTLISTLAPTPTETPQPTPTLNFVSLTKDAVLYSGPGGDGYEKISSLTAGTNTEALGKFGDFMLVRLQGANGLQEGYIPLVMFNEIPSDLPDLNVDQVPWKVFKSFATQEKPIDQQNDHDYWSELTLTRNLKFTSDFEMKLNMESMGSNGILFTYAEGGGEPWWKGTKRMEIFCEKGTLGIFLRDGTSEAAAFTNDDDRPSMPSNNESTTCQIAVRFDQYAKKIQFFQDNKPIYLLNPEEVGDFQGGLFPDGKILRIELSSSPKSGSSTSNVKLNELVFYIPPDGKFQTK